MRKILSFCLMLLSCLVVAGCGNDKDGQTNLAKICPVSPGDGGQITQFEIKGGSCDYFVFHDNSECSFCLNGVTSQGSCTYEVNKDNVNIYYGESPSKMLNLKYDKEKKALIYNGKTYPTTGKCEEWKENADNGNDTTPTCGETSVKYVRECAGAGCIDPRQVTIYKDTCCSGCGEYYYDQYRNKIKYNGYSIDWSIVN